MTQVPDFMFEQAAAARGFSTVCGVDEAGRGPLAGPVCAAAVVLPAGAVLPGLDDSKKLSAKRREQLYPQIIEQALAYGIAFASVEEIEEQNILNATFFAMNRAIAALQLPADYALIDGNRIPAGCPVPCETVVKGDAKSMSIAAASILAKVTRDRYMLELDTQYPQYGFAQHAGYGTKAHIAAIRTYGPSPVHRLSFLKNIL